MIMVCTNLLCLVPRTPQSYRLMDDDQIPTPEKYVMRHHGVIPGTTLTKS